METYTIIKDCRTEFTIEKSRFICTLKKVSTETEAQEFIRAVKKEYWNADHNCSCFVISDSLQRSSDDGEPSGTAGVPMLEVLQRQNLYGLAAVVTRYFGGIKLGTGGLVRAYSSSVSQAVAFVGKAKLVTMGRYTFSMPSSTAGKMENELRAADLFQLSQVDYGHRVTFELTLPVENLADANAWLTSRLHSLTQLKKIGTIVKEEPL